MSNIIKVKTKSGEEYLCDLQNKTLCGGIYDIPEKYYNSPKMEIGQPIIFALESNYYMTSDITEIYRLKDVTLEQTIQVNQNSSHVSKIHMINDYGTEYVCDLENKTIIGGASNEPHKFIYANILKNWDENDLTCLEAAKNNVEFILTEKEYCSSQNRVFRIGHIKSFKMERTVIPEYTANIQKKEHDNYAYER